MQAENTQPARQFDKLNKRVKKAEKELIIMRSRVSESEQSAEEKIRALYGKANYLQRENNLIRISFSFRIGRFITWLPRKIIGIFTHNKNR